MTTPFEQIDQSLGAVEESTDIIAGALANHDGYTDQGRDERWSRHTQEHRAHVDQLAETIGKIVPAAEEHVTAVRAEALPTPADTAAATVAEAQAARILNRPGMTDHKTAVQWFRDTPPSATRTAVVEELQARGVLNAEQVDGLIEEAHPAYSDAKRQLNSAQSLVNGVYRPRVEAVAARLDNRNAPLVDPLQRHRSSLFDALPPVNVGSVPTWTPNNAETVYRTH